jgi:hypothetical protein
MGINRLADIAYGLVHSQEGKQGREKRRAVSWGLQEAADLEDLDAELDIHSAWETIRENCK